MSLAKISPFIVGTVVVAGVAIGGFAADAAADLPPADARPPTWNWHVQNTDIVQATPGFSSQYSGPNSLDNRGEIRETVSFDLYAGARLWAGAEAHVDGLMWQGFGLSKTLGVEGFPNGEAFRLGTRDPKAIVARLFIRQTINLGGDSEAVGDDELNLAGKRDVSRLTLTLGKISVKDIFDNNTYANDPRTQFMNWALMANEAWDYPADSLGYMTGLAAELNEPGWAARYGFIQMPPVSNGMGADQHCLKAWGMVTELERDYTMAGHPGAVRLLVYDNRAHMGSYQAALDSPDRPADIVATRAYRTKTGFGVNAEQELAKNVGVFARLGWSDGKNEAWTFADVDRNATLGVSLKGEAWGRPGDTLALAGGINGISRVHQEFLAAGGTGILAGDGALSYGPERIMETYYDVRLSSHLNAALDYQFVANPAYNRDRGPVSIFALRLHWKL
jgi:high affinity Mn2+ porin